MNTKKRIKNLRNIAPDYPRIPHFNKCISNMTHDDISIESSIQFPITGYAQEKLDGANMGVSWNNNGPIIRNRTNILKKGYIEKNTPAKLQFRPAWNWLHSHKDEIKWISEQCYSPITIYGEFLYAKHSIYYDKLPDLFIAYDIWSVEDRNFLSPNICENLFSETSINFIKPEAITFSSINEIVKYSELPSNYRNGVREGIVIKTTDGKFIKDYYKVVNKLFVRREDFNETELIKNKVSGRSIK